MSDWTKLPPRFLEALTKHNGPIPPPERTLGPQIVEWLSKVAVFGEGDRFGQPVVLEPFQRAIFWKLFELKDDGSRRYRFALISLGKGSGKTPLGGWVATAELAGPVVFDGWNPDGSPKATRRTSPDILVMASSYMQADMILDEVRTTFTEGPLAKHANTFQGVVQLKGSRGKARRIPATVRQADGSKATVLLIDEAHELITERHENAYDVAAAGTAKRSDSLTALFSTAGYDLSTLFGKQVARGLRGDFTDEELFFYMQAEEGLDPTNDEDIAKGITQANPLVESGIANVNRLVSQFKSMPVFRAKRYLWNQWTNTDESWLPVGAWDRCKGETTFDPSLPTWLGVDMAIKRDSAAVVMLQRRLDGKLQASSRIWFPNGELIDQEEVDDYIRSVCATQNVLWIGADEAWWPTLPTLEAEGLPIVRVPQMGRNMVYAYSKTYRVIVDGVLVHDGAPDFSDQIASAVPQSTDGGWRLRKGKQKRRIDSCPALAGAVFVSELEVETEPVIPRSEVF
ncbi:hypothetical protein ITP53_25970 [Nonomuraea sp. K274]|uniref:Phage terminase large subunit-like protein n=1 Tax=Nonomuraea cypriaca TaxID=1187855 RepID=A0A931AC29_9ACTN|nr:terminase large subunit [Nonomuraea cypriaca]MBF8189118.1 hypothetical protein [Nonomuraea cypriaca]